MAGAYGVLPLRRTVAGVSERTSVEYEGPAAVADLYRRHLNDAQGRMATLLNLPVERAAAGARVSTMDGRELINCGGYGVFFVGASHPVVLAAVERQLRQQALSTRLLLNEPAAAAAHLLASVAPEGLGKVYFSSSGAEAVEAAIKIARANGHPRMVSMLGGYHGKTMGALSLTAQSAYQDPFQPLLPDVHHVPFGDRDALAEALSSDGRHSCVFIEPVQSEAGVIIPAPGVLKAVESICREYGAMLVLDEVMTGLGRLGAWWGAEREGVVPDILLVGKALSGGVVPVAATMTNAAMFAPFDADFQLHTATFSAAPIAMAAARATIEVIDAEDLVARSDVLGRRLLDRLRVLAMTYAAHLVTEVRGLGLLIGIEFVASEVAAEFLLAAIESGVLVNHSSNALPVIRLTPPAVLTDADEMLLLDAMDRAFRILAARYPHFETASQ